MSAISLEAADCFSAGLLRVQRHYSNMPLPGKAHPSDAGWDLIAMAVEPLRERVFAFDMGISVALSPGLYCELVPRSSIVKTDFMLANGVGVIDAEYRGRIRLVLRHLGGGDGMAEARELVGKRIAQLLVRRLVPVQLEAVDTLEPTRRGQGAFGSTGK